MKINHNWRNFFLFPPLTQKTIRVMKLSVLLTCILSLNTLASVYSQNAKFDLSVKDQTVRDILKMIEGDSQFRFFYNAEFADLDKKLTFSVKQQSIDDLMSLILDQATVGYKVLDNNFIVITPKYLLQQNSITGTVRDKTGAELPGVNVVIEGTTLGAITGIDGKYSIERPAEAKNLIFTFVGMEPQTVAIGSSGVVDVIMKELAIGLDEVIVVGYGTQKRSDITGTVASMSSERLEKAPNLNIAQAIQGSIPGVMIQTNSAGASPDEVIMIRGRNSILASNEPLIVVDGIPYEGEISDINPMDVKSIEILKDASAAAIYGSRGANGVILITSKEGKTGTTRLSYEGKLSFQTIANLPDLMNGEEFYNFKMERQPNMISTSEQAVYESGNWVNWLDLATRKGYSQSHNLSLSGGFEKTTFYIAGSLLDVQGIVVNDDYSRITSRINVDTKIKDWLTIGTRTQLSFDDASGQAPDAALTRMNPLSTVYDENGNLTIYPWPEDPHFGNPLESTLWKDIDKSYQVLTNNFALINFPFIKGLSYRLNSGVRVKFDDAATYYPTNGQTGYEVDGQSITSRTLENNIVIENILTYNKVIGKHSIFATALYSYEKNDSTDQDETASRFPHDFLMWYSAGQAEVSLPEYFFEKSVLVSQMLRLNYSYDSRYLLTVTGRRDGYSGFGSKSKWGIFPSVALGWNLANETFFPFKTKVNELKLRASYGLNGNQAVGAYETITRLGSADWITSQTVVPGYIPSTIGMDDLGWESSATLNVGIDFGFFNDRINGDINLYNTTTTDLLLNRTISAVHGITSVTQNIGKTGNNGLELSVNSKNIVTSSFVWSTTGNIALMKNRIISLYGYLDETGKEVDDITNKWFIGKPIKVNYDYVIDGVWQLDEAEEAASWGSQPGFIKLKDVNGDHQLTADDRQIVGQQDPKLIWGLTNSFSYKNFTLEAFVNGVHGVTKHNEYMVDDVYEGVKRNTINKDRWSPEHPENTFYINHIHAGKMAGIDALENSLYFEDASFIRIRDVSLSYDMPEALIRKAGIERMRLFVNGRNLFTFTKWHGMDPELNDQRNFPLQKEFVFGLNMGF